MRRLADSLDRLRHFPTVVADVATMRAEMDLFLADTPHATLAREWLGGGLPDGAFRPLSLMPILRGAPIVHGLAVGWHGISPRLPRKAVSPSGSTDGCLPGI